MYRKVKYEIAFRIIDLNSINIFWTGLHFQPKTLYRAHEQIV